MLKKTRVIGLAVMLVGFTCTQGIAADYTGMATDELAGMRGTLQEATSEERSVFQQEWQKRMQEMTPEERQQYTKRPANAAQDGSGNQYGRGKKQGRSAKAFQGNGSGDSYRGGGMGRRGGGGRR